MPEETHLEFKVGVFVLLAFVGLIVFTLLVGEVSIFDQGKDLRIVFGFANGLRRASPVRFAGVDAGVVKRVSLIFNEEKQQTQVEVIAWIKNSIQVPIDSQVMINQLGLLGEKYVEIIPGVDQRHFFQTGDSMVGVDPVLQESISQKIIDVASKLGQSIDGVNSIINDPESRQALKSTLVHLDSLSTRFDEMTAQIEAGHGTLGKLFYDDRLYDDLQSLSSDLKEHPWKLLYQPKKK